MGIARGVDRPWKGSVWYVHFCRPQSAKTQGGKAKGDHPTNTSIKEFFEKIDCDPDWFPGKHNGKKHGPKRMLTGAKCAAIVSAVKRLKSEGNEPTYSAVIAACPDATLNPNTGEPVHKERIYDVFRTFCYDDDPSDPWSHMSRLTRSALTVVLVCLVLRRRHKQRMQHKLRGRIKSKEKSDPV